jgi:hypothetical protein
MPDKPSQTEPFPSVQKNRAHAEVRTTARRDPLTCRVRRKRLYRAYFPANSNAFSSAAGNNGALGLFTYSGGYTGPQTLGTRETLRRPLRQNPANRLVQRKPPTHRCAAVPPANRRRNRQLGLVFVTYSLLIVLARRRLLGGAEPTRNRPNCDVLTGYLRAALLHYSVQLIS